MKITWSIFIIIEKICVIIILLLIIEGENVENFIWYNPTKLYFGKNQIIKLKDEVKEFKNVLLVYGGESIK